MMFILILAMLLKFSYDVLINQLMKYYISGQWSGLRTDCIAKFQWLWPVAEVQLKASRLGLLLRPAVFNIFIRDLDDGTDCTLNKFAGDKKLEWVVDPLDGCAAI